MIVHLKSPEEVIIQSEGQEGHPVMMRVLPTTHTAVLQGLHDARMAHAQKTRNTHGAFVGL